VGNGLGFGHADEAGLKIALTAAWLGLLATTVGFVADTGKPGLNAGFAMKFVGISLGLLALTVWLAWKLGFVLSPPGSLWNHVALPKANAAVPVLVFGFA
jgi:hypothetical protein